MGSQLNDLKASEIPRLIAALGSMDPVVRERARVDLVSLGHAAVIPLIHELGSPSSHVCWEAAKALGSLRDPAAATALAATLEHEDGDVRWAAANALIALGSEGLKQTLVTLLTKADSVQTRRAAYHVISHFGHLYRGEPLMPLLAKFRTFEPGVAIPSAALDALHAMERGTLRFAFALLESPGSHISVK